MSRAADSLLETALRLPESERADLAARLIESLDPSQDEGAGTAWAEEIRRRTEDLDRGRVRPIPWSEARRRILDDSDGPEAG